MSKIINLKDLIIRQLWKIMMMYFDSGDFCYLVKFSILNLL